MDTPNAMATTAPSDAPLETPSVEPSASGFLRSPCIDAPHSDKDAPTSATHSTRGRRTRAIMAGWRMCAGTSSPKIVHRMTVKVSFSGTRTLPTDTQIVSVTSVASGSSTHKRTEKPFRFRIAAMECLPFRYSACPAVAGVASLDVASPGVASSGVAESADAFSFR